MGPGARKEQGIRDYIEKMAGFNAAEHTGIFQCEAPCCKDKTNGGINLHRVKRVDNLELNKMQICALADDGLGSLCGNKSTRRAAVRIKERHNRSTRHTLMRYVASVQDINVEVLADCGASDNFLSLHIATQAHLKLIELDKPTSATLANGSSLQIRHMVKDVPVQIGDYVCLVDFKVMSMSSLSMVLGKPWFNDADPHMSWRTNTMHIRTSHGDFTIAPNGSTSSVNFQEFNLMNLQDVNALSERKDRLMCMSIHGVNKEEEPPPGVQTELLSHEGHMYTI